MTGDCESVVPTTSIRALLPAAPRGFCVWNENGGETDADPNHPGTCELAQGMTTGITAMNSLLGDCGAYTASPTASPTTPAPTTAVPTASPLTRLGSTAQVIRLGIPGGGHIGCQQPAEADGRAEGRDDGQADGRAYGRADGAAPESPLRCHLGDTIKISDQHSLLFAVENVFDEQGSQYYRLRVLDLIGAGANNRTQTGAPVFSSEAALYLTVDGETLAVDLRPPAGREDLGALQQFDLEAVAAPTARVTGEAWGGPWAIRVMRGDEFDAEGGSPTSSPTDSPTQRPTSAGNVYAAAMRSGRAMYLYHFETTGPGGIGVQIADWEIEVQRAEPVVVAIDKGQTCSALNHREMWAGECENYAAEQAEEFFWSYQLDRDSTNSGTASPRGCLKWEDSLKPQAARTIATFFEYVEDNATDTERPGCLKDGMCHCIEKRTTSFPIRELQTCAGRGLADMAASGCERLANAMGFGFDFDDATGHHPRNSRYTGCLLRDRTFRFYEANASACSSSPSTDTDTGACPSRSSAEACYCDAPAAEEDPCATSFVEFGVDERHEDGRPLNQSCLEWAHASSIFAAVCSADSPRALQDGCALCCATVLPIARIATRPKYHFVFDSFDDRFRSLLDSPVSLSNELPCAGLDIGDACTMCRFSTHAVDYAEWCDRPARCSDPTPGSAHLNATSGSARFNVTSGSANCVVDPHTGCVSDGIGNHDNGENCTIEVLTNGVLSAAEFVVEAHATCAYDYIRIDSTKYCGTTGPTDVAVTAGTILTWHSDHSVTTTGWDICLREPHGKQPPSPPPPPHPWLALMRPPGRGINRVHGSYSV